VIAEKRRYVEAVGQGRAQSIENNRFRMVGGHPVKFVEIDRGSDGSAGLWAIPADLSEKKFIAAKCGCEAVGGGGGVIRKIPMQDLARFVESELCGQQRPRNINVARSQATG